LLNAASYFYWTDDGRSGTLVVHHPADDHHDHEEV